MMSPGLHDGGGYVTRLGATLQLLLRPFRPATHPDLVAARRAFLRQVALIGACGAALVLVLMIGLDATGIGWMPARGTASLWPLRIITDFGKDVYVMWTLGVLLVGLVLVGPLTESNTANALSRLVIRIEFMLLAVAVPLLAGTLLKWVVGRGRPFVGGQANAFNFQPFQGSEAYYSLPSGHAVTAFALAFAVAALWPRLRLMMALYALTIAATRLVLLAHHPSDVVAGAIVGIAGAALVRYWFAVRHSGFMIDSEGKIQPA